jgi:hypothetical protein
MGEAADGSGRGEMGDVANVVTGDFVGRGVAAATADASGLRPRNANRSTNPATTAIPAARVIQKRGEVVFTI